jgi:hypothetical protein
MKPKLYVRGAPSGNRTVRSAANLRTSRPLEEQGRMLSDTSVDFAGDREQPAKLPATSRVSKVKHSLLFFLRFRRQAARS